MMTRFLLGVAVGYLFRDVIDELLGKAKETVKEESETVKDKVDTAKKGAEAAKEAMAEEEQKP